MEQQFLDLETRWMNAWKNQDVTTCSEILADDFTLTSSISSGDLMTKEQWLAALSTRRCKSFRFDKIKVREYGNTAIVNSWFYQEADANGKNWSGNFLLTDVWVNKTGKWQVATRHASWLQDQ